MEAAGIALRLVAAHPEVRDLLRAEGLEERMMRKWSKADCTLAVQQPPGVGGWMYLVSRLRCINWTVRMRPTLQT